MIQTNGLKNILLLTSNKSQIDTILATCNNWNEELSINPVKDENEAVNISLHDSADLLIADVSERSRTEIDKLFKFTYAVPFVPCIAIINDKLHKPEDLLKLGASCCITAPYSSLELYRWVSELLDVSTSSVIKGIPIHSLLQMLEGEGKTCTLKVRSDHGSGLLFLEDGNIISAEYGSLTKEDAAHSIIVLENCLVEIRYYNRLRKRELHQNAVSLIMEALRLQDEKRDLQELQEKKNKTRLDLKKFTPASHSIDVEIGAKLKLDFNGCDESLTSNLIGIVPDKYVIISVPSASRDTINVLEEGNEVLVRYMNLGKLCLFKTHIQKIVTDPTNLLFLEFPSVIFYHELRKEKRTKIFLPSVLRADRDNEFYSVITDLSIMGCLCEIKAKLNSPFPELNIGDSVLINCLLPGLDEKETVEGVVRNIKKTPDQMRLGIQFDKPAEKVTKSISNYLNILQNVA